MFSNYDTASVKILSINVINRPQRVKSDVKNRRIPFTVLMARGSDIAKKYRIRNLPYLFIIDQKGIIHTSKKYLKYDKIKKALDELIKPPGKISGKNN